MNNKLCLYIQILTLLTSYKLSYPKIKIVITSRMDSNYLEDIEIKNFIRLKRFDATRVNCFLERYGSSMKYKEISSIGISHEVVTTPLFCWMLAQRNSEEKFPFTIDSTWDAKKTKALLYFEFTKSVRMGKAYNQMKKYVFSNFQEKQLLRKISALNQIHSNELMTERLILNGLQELGVDVFVGKEQESGLLFLLNGKIIDGSYSWGKGLVSGTEQNNMLLFMINYLRYLNSFM